MTVVQLGSYPLQVASGEVLINGAEDTGPVGESVASSSNSTCDMAGLPSNEIHRKE